MEGFRDQLKKEKELFLNNTAYVFTNILTNA